AVALAVVAGDAFAQRLAFPVAGRVAVERLAHRCQRGRRRGRRGLAEFHVHHGTAAGLQAAGQLADRDRAERFDATGHGSVAPFAGNRAPADVAAVEGAGPVDRIHAGVRAALRVGHAVAQRGHTQYAAAGADHA